VVLLHGPIWRAGRMRALVWPYLRVTLPTFAAMTGFVALVELASFVTIGAHEGKALHVFGGALDPASPWPWTIAASLLLIGAVIARGQGRAFAVRWAAISEGIATQ
jgi:branched-chain amino acid transport system permease protein